MSDVGAGASKGSGATRWVLASSNPGKVREIQALLAPRGVQIITQRDLGIADAEEPHLTFVENALAKARHAAAASGLPALADDSGICVPALGGAPGVRSARYALDASGAEHDAPAAAPAVALAASASREQIDAANNRLLTARTRHLTVPVRCEYVCLIVLVRSADDPRPLVAEGVWRGEWQVQARGEGGFGYDPHFLPDGSARTAAEMPAADKNRSSHRARALADLLARLDAGG